MIDFRPVAPQVWLLFAGAAIAIFPAGAARAQMGPPATAAQFDLSAAVQVDEINGAVRARVDRVKPLLAARQWDEAVETLRRLDEMPENRLLAVAPSRYLGLHDWCQAQLAALPPEALARYRRRVDPVAREWYERGIAGRERQPLQQVVDQALGSSYGDQALMALGTMALESGDFAAARFDWERLLPGRPAVAADGTGSVPATMDLATVRARLVLVSILEGSRPQAAADLSEFARLYPGAQGWLGGKRGRYADLLQELLHESAAWPAPPARRNWSTFAGNFCRNKIAPALADLRAVGWRFTLRGDVARPETAWAGDERAARPERARVAEGFHPLLVDNLVLVNTGQEILAVDRATGGPAWGGSRAIYRGERSPAAMVHLAWGAPQWTMTVVGHRLYARVGSPLTDQGQGPTPAAPGWLVCLDLAAEGRLLWKIAAEEGYAFEGSPVADQGGVYVALRRRDVRPQALVAGLDADTGRVRWRSFICSAETPPRGALPECSHNLLTLAGGMLYYNTNLGAVAALRTDDGRMAWLSLYPRALSGNLSEPAAHWRRDPSPCLLDHGTLLVAPADSPRIFAFDAAAGTMLWQTRPEVEDALDLLGVAGDSLIAGGGRLYWIGLSGPDRGRVTHVWPDGPDHPGHGRGVLAGDNLLWPTRDKLYIFDAATARQFEGLDLRALGASGGNLLVAPDCLLIATETELIALGPNAGRGAGERSK
jgi:outer membrane protein assembly factor BamB